MNYDGRIDTDGTPAHGERAGAHDVRLDYPAVDPALNPLDITDEAEIARRKRHVVLGAGAAVALIALWFGVHHSRPAALDADAAGQAPSVSVMVPGRASVVGTISATGVLAARHDMPVGSVGEGGAITRVLVNPGQWVKKGQLLATIDRSVQNQQSANQQAQIKVAEADARLAQANLDRALKLVSHGFISQADVDRLTATRDAAAARVRVAGALAGEIGARIRRLDIVAPADGLVLDRTVEEGQVVGPSSGALFRIAEHGDMELRAKLSEGDLAQLSLGQPAKVTPVGAPAPVVGRIWQLSPVIDPQSRQGMARIALAYAPQIRPGGFATVDINSGLVVAPVLPESALQADNQGSYVYVVGKDNKAQRRSVKLGTVSEQGVAIISGLAGNERVVVRAGAFLSVGETVNPKIAPTAAGGK